MEAIGNGITDEPKSYPSEWLVCFARSDGLLFQQRHYITGNFSFHVLYFPLLALIKEWCVLEFLLFRARYLCNQIRLGGRHTELRTNQDSQSISAAPC